MGSGILIALAATAGQVNTHLSIAIDPSDTNVVDIQETGGPVGNTLRWVQLLPSTPCS